MARLVYPVIVVILVAAYYAVPILRPVTTATIGGVSVTAITIGLTQLRPRRWAGWLLIALSVVLLAVGDAIFTTLAVRTPGPVDYPSAPDVFYLAAYLPLAVGLLWLGRPRLPSRDWPMLLDTIALSLAGSLLVWIILVRPAVLSMDLDGLGKVTAVGSWVGYVAVLAASARVVLAWRTNVALGLLAAAVISFLAADFFYGRQLINGTWSTGSLIDLGFLGFSVLCGAAALTPSMRRVASAGYARHQLGPARLAMVAVALLVAPTLLLVQATNGPVTTGVAIAIVAGAVAVLMLVRLALSAQAYRSRAGREHAVRVASRALVLATTDAEVLAGVRAALRSMLPPVSADTAEAYLIVDRDRHASGTALLPHGTTGELAVPVDARVGVAADPRVFVFTAPMAELVELSSILPALADQAGSALHRIDLLAGLRAEERERYFRTLVLASDDVTLISRRDRITYATPSALALFGRDVTGESFDDLLEPWPHPDRRPVPRWPVNGSRPADGYEASVRRGGADAVIVRVRRRDLSDDPTVAGVVTTLRDVTAERHLQQDLAHRASHDALTGLANAQLFTDELKSRPGADRRVNAGAGPGSGSGSGFGKAALFIDLDNFKTVNDTYGHQVGDRLLTEVAQRIQSCLRAEDLAARLGGDEFAVLLRDVTSPDDARRVAQRIVDALARPAIVDTIAVDCQASVGLAITDQPEEPDTLMREADTALYSAKAHGKGRWQEFRDGMATPTRRHIEERRRLEDALSAGVLTVHYQPIVAIDTGRTVGFEALIRLPGADPPMPPDEIVAIAEDTGLIISLGDRVLRQALTDAVRLNRPGDGSRYVSVNVSARQLRRPDFVDTVRAHLTATGIDASLLVLEITESFLVEADDRAWAFLAELRRDGVRVAIDDYGTGYASLSYLRQPGIDLVKIDQSFLDDLTEPRNRVLLEAVASLCGRLGLVAVAEGIHDTVTRDILLAVGVRFGQGYYYAAPMSITNAVATLPALPTAAPPARPTS